VFLHAGPEISVASTKAYLSQLTVLALLTLFLGRQRDMSREDGQTIATELQMLPEKIQKILDGQEAIKKLAHKYAKARDFLFIGRKYNFGTAFEGALKLKETTYIHAEACGAGEMKHGHLAMIDEHFPTMAIAPSDSVYEKMMSNIQEIRTRKGPVIAIATDGNEDIRNVVNDLLYIPKTIDMLTPILAVVPLHLFAYYFAKEKGLNVDRPRNLAKSVTVE
jgi:glucosamine--fructose-6-phosphate aminotransferase (isomerizing)